MHEAGGLLHVDAIQGLGKIPFDIKGMKADLVSLSAHKIGGPKGVGALVLTEEAQGLEPLLRGGGQELGRRAGTENVAGISAFGAAVRAAVAHLEDNAARLRGLRDRLEAGLKQTPDMVVFSEGVPRLPNTTLFTVPGLKAETAVIGFDLAVFQCLPALPARPARSSHPTSWRPWALIENWPRERCGSVWAGLPRRQTLIWPFRLGESLLMPYLRGRRNTA